MLPGNLLLKVIPSNMFTDITQITKTDTTDLSVDKVIKNRNGALVKCAEAGVIKVEYLHDNEGTVRDLVVSGDSQWLPDRIRKIISTGTTVSAASILIGYN